MSSPVINPIRDQWYSSVRGYENEWAAQPQFFLGKCKRAWIESLTFDTDLRDQVKETLKAAVWEWMGK